MEGRFAPSVLWREGMLLCPQHLQAFAREIGARTAAGDAAGLPGAFGLLALDVDEEALARDVFAIRSAQALFRDGTLASIPQGATCAQREFGELFTEAELLVWLGIQALQDNVPQIGEDAERAYRYEVEVAALPDENLRDQFKEIELRRLRARLFFGDEDRSGFETLPIALLVRRGKPQAHSALSESYVAPVLAAGASTALVAQLGEVAGRARSQARDLAVRVPDIARLSSVEKGADLSGLLKLMAVNQCVVALEQVARAGELHPFHVYCALGNVAGALAVFGPERVAPELPVYEHARANECFAAAFEQVRQLLAAEVAVPYDTTEFRRDEQREGFFAATIPSEWLDAGALFYVAVEMDRPPEEVAELVGAGVKLIPPSDIDRVVQGVVPGIGLEPLRGGQISFPKRPVLHYFRVETEGRSRESWLKVLEARSAVLLSALGAMGEVRYHFYVELTG